MVEVAWRRLARRAAPMIVGALVVASCAPGGFGSPAASPPPSVAAAAPAPRPATAPIPVPPAPTPVPPAPTPSASEIEQPGDLAPGEGEDVTTIANRPMIAFTGSDPWQIQRPSTSQHPAEGYADAPSYLPGGRVRFAVNTDASSYRIVIFRVGFTIDPVFASPLLPGTRQTATQIVDAMKLVRASWSWTYAFDVPPGWPSAVYLAKIEATGGGQSYVPFVVRSTHPTTYLFVHSTLTDEAYNTWGAATST